MHTFPSREAFLIMPTRVHGVTYPQLTSFPSLHVEAGIGKKDLWGPSSCHPSGTQEYCGRKWRQVGAAEWKGGGCGSNSRETFVVQASLGSLP